MCYVKEEKISLKKIKNTLVGMAVLDGKVRSEDFIYFMRERAQITTSHLGLSDTLYVLIKECLADIAKHTNIGCIIPIPSKTWCLIHPQPQRSRP